MAKGRQITIEFLGNARDLQSAVGDVEQSTSGLSGKLKKFGAVAATGLVAAGAGAVVAGKYFFDTGARLEQMGQKADTVFGGSLGSVEKWADKTAHAMGLTTREATGLAANFGDLLIPMGFTRKEAAKMSTDVVGLSGALSQWSGGTKSAAEVTDILSAAMLGETDGLKGLGISIGAADIEAQLLAKGQDKLTGAARQQAEAQAIQALIMAKSTDAQKAFAEGGSPLLSAQAKIKAAFWEMRDELAVRLVPAFAKVGAWLVDVGLPAMQRFGGWIKANVIPVVKDLAAQFADRVMPVVRDLAAQIQANVIPVVKQLAEFFTTQLLPAVRSAAEYVMSRLVPVFVQVAAIVQTKVLPIIRSLAEFFVTQLLPAGLKIYQNVATKLRPVFDQLVATFQQKVLPTVVKLLAKFEEWRPTIQKVVLVVQKIIGKVLEFAAVILAKVLPVAIRFAGWLISALVPAIAKGIEIVAKIIGKIIEFGIKIFNAGQKVAEFAGKVREKIGQALGYVQDIPGKIMGAIGNFGTLLYQTGKDLIQGLINGIKAMAGELVHAITSSVTDKIPGFIKDRLGIHSPSKVLAGLGVNIMEGLIVGIRSRQTAVQTALEKVTAFIVKQAEKIKGLLSERNSFAGQFQGFTSSVFGADFTNPESGASTATPEALIAWQKQQKSKALALKADVGKLLKMGLSPALLRQLAESGESGIAQIHALAQGSGAQVKELNALNAATTSALSSAGMAAGNDLYGNQIAEARRDQRAAEAIARVLDKWADKQDKNTQVVIKLEGRTLQMSLLELKRKNGKNLGLT